MEYYIAQNPHTEPVLGQGSKWVTNPS